MNTACDSDSPRRRAADRVTAADLFTGGGEVAALMRQVDWAASPLGPVNGWSQALRTTVRTILHSHHPMFLWWGRDLVQFYNDAYRPSLGRGKHPYVLGRPGRESWSESWSIIGPQIEAVMQHGTPSWNEDQLVPIERNGEIEDAYWTYGYSPVYDDKGEVGGTLVVCTETTARVLGERALRESRAREKAAIAAADEARLASLFKNAPLPICTLRGPDHVYELVNPLYQRLVGDGRELVGLPVREALPEIVTQGFIERLDAVYRTGELFVAREVPIRLDRHHDGTLEDAVLHQTYQPRRDSSGQIVGIDVFGFDVTEQVQARRRIEVLSDRLRESEERLRQVVEASGTGTWEVNLSNQELVADARFRKMFNLTPDEPFTLAQGLSIIHSEDSPRVAQAVADAIAGKNGGSYAEEYRTVPLPNGATQWVEARGHATFGADGKATHFWGTGVDVTVRKEAEAAQARLLAAVADQPLMCVALLQGQDLVFKTANDLYRQMVGGRDVVGKSFLAAVPELDGQGFDAVLANVMRTGEPFIGHEMHMQLDRRGRGVEAVYFNCVFQPVRGAFGLNDAVLIIGTDVTDEVLCRREDQLREKSRAEFEQQLIGIVSHDLRNPTSVITMSAAILLRRPDLDDLQRKSLGRILAAAERTGRMIRDLLDFTQARLGGGLPIEPKAMNLHRLARQIVDELQVAHPERRLKIEQHGSGDGVWDGDRVAQVLGNLLSNAIHYSPVETPVEVRTRREDDQMVLEVHNTGAPIPADVLPMLFQPLQRGAAAPDRTNRSVGLGLYIVDSIVRAHGGRIDVKSQANEGTTLTVRLPSRPHAPDGSNAPPH